MNKKRKCDAKQTLSEQDEQHADLTMPSFGNSTSIIPPSINAYSETRRQVIYYMIYSIIYKL